MNHTSPTLTLPTLGFTVWWSLAGIRVPHDTLAATLTTYGFQGFLPTRPGHHIALRRALTALLRGNTARLAPEEEEADASRLFIRTIPERAKGQLVFAIIHENVDFRALGLAHATSLRVRLDKKAGLITITSQERGDIYAPPAQATPSGDGIVAIDDAATAFADALRPFWRKYKDLHIAADLSRMMRDIVCGDLIARTPRRAASKGTRAELHAVSLRPGGGLYFVPGDRRETLERLEQMLYSLPTDSLHAPFFVAQALLDEAKAKGQLARAVHEGFLSELQTLQTDLAHLTQTDSHKPATLAGRLTAYRKVKAKVSMYADLLGMQQADVLKQLQVLQTRVEQLVLGDAPATAVEQLFCPAA